MNVRQIQAFLAIINYGGIRAAGRAIHLSPSAITRSVAQLEEELHCVLLIRGNSGSGELTAEGKAFLPYATSIMEELSRAQETISQMNGGDVGTVRAAVSPFLPSHVVSKAFHLFRSRFKRVNLEIRDGLYAHALPALQAGRIDFAVTLITDTLVWPNDNFAVKRLFNVRQGLIAHKDHPIHKSKNPLDVSRYEWLITADNLEDAKNRIGETFVKKGVPWPTNITVCDLEQHDQLLRDPSSDVIGVAPLTLQEEREEKKGILKLVRFEESPLEKLLMLPDLIGAYLTRSSIPLTPAGQYFADCLLYSIASWQKENPELFVSNERKAVASNPFEKAEERSAAS